MSKMSLFDEPCDETEINTNKAVVWTVGRWMR